MTFVGLVLVGVGLTAYLPKPSISKPLAYVIDKKTLDKPLAQSVTQLSLIDDEAQQFCLLLGSYIDLSTATRQATQLQLNKPIDIITFKDSTRIWYALIFGNYPFLQGAREMQSQLQQEYNTGSSIIKRPPTEAQKE